jgi:hypothetical protein
VSGGKFRLKRIITVMESSDHNISQKQFITKANALCKERKKKTKPEANSGRVQLSDDRLSFESIMSFILT